MREAKDAYWAEIVDIQRQVAAAWVPDGRARQHVEFAGDPPPGPLCAARPWLSTQGNKV